MKVSIITTTYKHEYFIAQTIESIINQTFSNRELLIGDDSPDDKTRSIIQKYLKQYPNKIKARHNLPNKGIVNNMNFLLSKVDKNSQYISFLEGDDIYTSNHLEEKIKIFKKYNNIAMVYNNLDFINDKGKVFYRDFLKKAPFYLKNTKLTKEEFIKNETFYGSWSSLMIKKKIIEKEKIINPTNDKLWSVSDRDVFFRIAIKYKCYGISESLTLYRRHENSVSRNNQKLFTDLQIQIQEYYKNWFINKSLYNYKFSFIQILKAVGHIEENKRKKSLKNLFYSFQYNFFSFPIYKIGILVMNFLPQNINKTILKKLIKRN